MRTRRSRRLLFSSGLSFKTIPPNMPPVCQKIPFLSFVGLVYGFCCSLLVLSCNSLLFPNKSIFAGKITDCLMFKANGHFWHRAKALSLFSLNHSWTSLKPETRVAWARKMTVDLKIWMHCRTIWKIKNSGFTSSEVILGPWRHTEPAKIAITGPWLPLFKK